MFETYRPSGRFGISVPAWFIAGAGIVAVVAFIYQFLIFWIPLIYVNFLVTLGFGFCIGMVGAAVVSLGHVRSTILAAAIGVALCGCGLGAKFWFQYQHMVGVYTDELMAEEGVPTEKRDDLLREVKKEVTFVRHLQIRAEHGWNVGRGAGAPINGVFVYIIWAIEAGIVLFVAVTATSSAGGEPYCEQLGKWADEEEAVMLLPITSLEMVAKIKSANLIEQLLEIPIPDTDESHQFALYKVNSVEGEEMEDAYLTVDLLTVTTNEKGEEETKEENLVKHAILSKAHRERLVDNASLLQEAMDDYRAAMDEKQLNTQSPPASDSDAEPPLAQE